MLLFSHAAELWLASKAGLAEKSRERYEQCVTHLKKEFGKGLVCYVDANDIGEYRRKRRAARLRNWIPADCGPYHASQDGNGQPTGIGFVRWVSTSAEPGPTGEGRWGSALLAYPGMRLACEVARHDDDEH